MRLLTITTTAFAAFAALALCLPASATTCQATIGTISPVPTVVYDPFDGLSVTETFTVELQNTGTDSCSLALAIQSAGAGSTRYFRMGSNKLRYEVETPGGSDYDNDINDPRGSISLGANKTTTVDVKVKVPSGLIAPAGDYTDGFKIKLYRNSGGGHVGMGTVREVPNAANVEKRAQVNIAGTSGSGSWGVERIDFDTLTTNETRSAKVQVRATTGVTVKVESQNKGFMKHKTLPGDPGVPYGMKLAGSNVNLTGAYDELNVSPPVSLDGTSYSMVLTVGNVNNRPAGDYKDLLTISVSPN